MRATYPPACWPCHAPFARTPDLLPDLYKTRYLESRSLGRFLLPGAALQCSRLAGSTSALHNHTYYLQPLLRYHQFSPSVKSAARTGVFDFPYTTKVEDTKTLTDRYHYRGDTNAHCHTERESQSREKSMSFSWAMCYRLREVEGLAGKGLEGGDIRCEVLPIGSRRIMNLLLRWHSVYQILD